MLIAAMKGMVDNVAHLLTLGVLYVLIPSKTPRRSFLYMVLAGACIGIIGITVMIDRWELLPGLIFDTRSILLVVTGLFFGYTSTILAAVMMIAFRIYEGGVGASMGVGVIISSAAIGLLWRYYYPEKRGWFDYYLLGLINHVVMLVCAFLMPYSIAITTLKGVAAPVLIIYPIGTMLLAKLLDVQRLQRDIKDKAVYSETRLKLMLENSWGIVSSLDINGVCVFVSDSIRTILGYDPLEIILHRFDSIVHPEDRTMVLHCIESLKAQPGAFETQNFRLKHKRGHWVWFENKVTNLLYNTDINAFVINSRDITERYENEKQLKASEEKYRMLAENALEGVFQTSLEGEFLYSNPFLASMLGYDSVNELMNTVTNIPNQLYVNKNDRSDMLQILKNEGGMEKFETKLFKKDGSEVWVSMNIWAMNQDQNSDIHFGGTLVDISDRKKFEEALTRSEERHKQTEKVAHLGSWETNLLTGETFWSDEFYRICGYEPGSIEPIAEIESQITHPDDQKRVQKLVKAALNTGAPYDFEKRIIRPDGSVRWVHSIGQVKRNKENVPEKLGGSFQDITDRKLFELALLESKNLYSSIIQTAMDGFWLADSQGNILEVNNAYCDMSGYTQDELTKMHISDLDVVETHDLTVAHLQQIVNDIGIRFESKHHHKNGSEFDVEVSAKYLHEKGGYAVAFLRDVTHRKQTEKRLRENERLLASSQEIAHLGSWMLDLTTGELSWSDETYRIFGCLPQEFNATYEMFMEFVHQDDREKVNLSYNNSVKNGKDHYAIEHRIIRKDTGEERVVFEQCIHERDENGQVVRSLGMIQDITERETAKNKIKESTIKYRSLIQAMPDIVMRFDRDLRHLFVSDSVKTVVDMEPEVFIGKTHRELGFSEEQCEEWEERIHKVFITGEPLESEFELENGGTNHVFNWRIVPELDDDGEVKSVLSLARDITKQKQVEQDYEILFRKMLNGFALHEIICDDSGSPIDYRFLAVNPAFEKMTGLVSDNIIGNTVLEVLPDTEPFWIETYGRVALTGEPVLFENESKALNKFFEVTAFRPAPFQFACLFDDITQRKIAEQALLENEAKFRSVIEQSNDAIYILYHNKLELVNKRFCEITGIPLEDAIGENFSLDDIVDYENIFPDGENKKTGRYDTLKPGMLGVEIVHKNGEKRFVEISINEISYQNDKALLGVIRDITEQRTLETQLRQAQKIESIGHLAGGIAHDFNNLLTPIIANTEIAMMEMDPSHELFRDLSDIYETGCKASDLTRQLLAFSRKQILDVNLFDLNKVINKFGRILRRTIREDVEIIMKFNQANCMVKVDRSQIEQVIMNLFVNAQDAMPGGGQIRITTNKVHLEEDFFDFYTQVQQGDYVQLSISDTGTGIDSKIQEKIFDPFFTTKGEGKGTGLGLSTTYGIIKQHDGYIKVDSKPGEGATFEIYLPLVSESLDDKEIMVDTSEYTFNGETVLVVEDQTVVRKTVEKILSKIGLKSLIVENPQNAIELVQSNNLRIDLLLTDIVMPEINGRELHNRLLEYKPGLKVLYMSGYSSDVISHHGIKNQDVNFIQKPFTFHELSQKIKDTFST